MIKFDNVSYRYAHQENYALFNINFEVPSGKIVLCTGASGCGKTTLMRLANGLCPHHYKGTLEGNVSIFGQDTSSTSIGELSNSVGTLFQDPEQQFFALTVSDEIAFAHECKAVPAEQIIEILDRVLENFSITPIKDSSIHALSEGQKQKVGLASLCSQSLKAIILDEPTANLDPESTLDLAQKIIELKKCGMAIFIVDHRLYWLENIADEVLVMSDGNIKERGDFSILYDSSLRAKYGLREAQVDDTRYTLAQVDEKDKENCALFIENMSFAYKDKPTIFEKKNVALPKGITALIGDNGAGKTTLARIMTGLNKVQCGTFYLDGKIIEQKKLLKHIGVVLQNADFQLQMSTVVEEIQTCILLAEELKLGKRLRFKKKERVIAFYEESIKLLEQLGLENLKDRHPQSLSGGEKQRLIIACALAKKPKILILDEPTSGLDGKNMLRIKDALDNFASKGTSILVITHDLELITKSCQHALRLTK